MATAWRGVRGEAVMAKPQPLAPPSAARSSAKDEFFGGGRRAEEGKVEEALKLANDAADREDAVDKAPLTPGEVVPAREIYGDMLFEVGKYEEALLQYQIVLDGSPNRLNALLGVAMSAKAAGRPDIALEYTRIIRNQTRFGDRKFSGL